MNERYGLGRPPGFLSPLLLLEDLNKNTCSLETIALGEALLFTVHAQFAQYCTYMIKCAILVK